MNPQPCRHRSGYWIAKGISFRCYGCGHQFRLSDLMPLDREIEVWRETRKRS